MTRYRRQFFVSYGACRRRSIRLAVGKLLPRHFPTALARRVFPSGRQIEIKVFASGGLLIFNLNINGTLRKCSPGRYRCAVIRERKARIQDFTFIWSISCVPTRTSLLERDDRQNFSNTTVNAIVMLYILIGRRIYPRLLTIRNYCPYIINIAIHIAYLLNEIARSRTAEKHYLRPDIRNARVCNGRGLTINTCVSGTCASIANTSEENCFTLSMIKHDTFWTRPWAPRFPEEATPPCIALLLQQRCRSKLNQIRPSIIYLECCYRCSHVNVRNETRI